MDEAFSILTDHYNSAHHAIIDNTFTGRITDRRTYKRMPGMDDLNVHTTAINSAIGIIVTKDRNPGTGRDGLCRIHLNAALDLAERMGEVTDFGDRTPECLYTMPLIAVLKVPDGKKTDRIAEQLLKKHETDIVSLYNSHAVPLVHVDENGLRPMATYKELWQWRGDQRAESFKDSPELMARLGHFMYGSNFFRKKRFESFAPAGQKLGLL